MAKRREVGDSPSRLRLIVCFLAVLRDIQARVHLDARRWALRDLQGRVLHAVRRRTPATTSAIARSLGISRQLAAYHLQRLTDLGFVKRDGLRFLPRPSR